ncbi:hypothetical protein SERLADRAFT_369398 [Serpula lacrymans var. lacrymans S7.9]|uniref:Uncharacterized protein n=1 Tax=Serpula lacrymans var. lacrymans (strain S7.9) TaxID=578457 RepID=F8NXR9_SERL9|nr:uncharacterized protein SERLADRAFT_369398 [Serpula lacrymans var. lacrymans S7.9]EGO24165.1 hypothetical protein SERLADRAFT_369398 [Serpula lacrymans var. lacrymans S7.9]
MPPTTRDSFSCWDGFDVLFDKAFASPATPSQSQSELAFDRHAAPEPRRHYPQSSSGTTIGPSPLDREYQALNQLWETIRQRKEREMAKSPPKVKSLETPPAASPPPASVPHKPAPKLKRRKSEYVSLI